MEDLKNNDGNNANINLLHTNGDANLILVHTSGSTGKPKPMWVERSRMEASARITCQFLGLTAEDTALLCLSEDYIAGKMMRVRSEVCGMRLIEVKPSGHPLAGLTETPTFAAMVPMQVYNSLLVPEERQLLMGIRNIIIGGGAVSAEMAAELRQFPNAIWSTYGMTETLSHIALRRLSGPEASDRYTPFESVRVSTNADGVLVIDAPRVCPDRLVTNDIVELHPDGRRFRIRGRRDNVICSGGLKLQIEEIEAALQPYMPCPFAITKRPDSKFGEVAVLVAATKDVATLKTICQEHLPKYWHPHHIVSVTEIPMTETGKPARAQIRQLASI